ncbi:MAG: GntR family transcriptional regulator [Proteobacteria bacterium]|nr:GntR family transcriptional regulator [Pseudomonadota bacterium]
MRAVSLVDQVYAAVHREVANGDIPPGTSVNIADLARRLDVSATPVREALARLAAEGLLLFEGNIGYRTPPLPNAADYVDWAVARVVVECNALKYVLGPLDTRVLDEAAALNDAIANATFGTDAAGIRRFSELNWQFHAKLIELARNPLLAEIHARLNAAPQFSRIFLKRGILHQSRVAAEHRTILARLRRNDRAAAVTALRAHILHSLERDSRLSDVAVSLRRIEEIPA